MPRERERERETTSLDTGADNLSAFLFAYMALERFVAKSFKTYKEVDLTTIPGLNVLAILCLSGCFSKGPGIGSRSGTGTIYGCQGPTS